MASFKAQIREAEVKADGKCNIKIRVSHNGQTRYIPTQYHCDPNLFDNEAGNVKQKHPNYRILSRELRSIVEGYEDTVIDKLGESRLKNMDCQKLIVFLKDIDEVGDDFFVFAAREIDTMRKNAGNSADAPATPDIYQGTINHMLRFEGHEVKSNRKSNKVKKNIDIPLPILHFEEIDYNYLVEFDDFLTNDEVKDSEGHIVKKPLAINSVNIHMRNLRHLLYEAKKKKLFKMIDNPFDEYELESEEPGKRNIDLPAILKLKNAELTDKMDIVARDTFLLIFYLIGINVKDLLYLLHEDYENGRIDYKRFKTKKKYSIMVYPEAEELLKKYAGKTHLVWFNEEYSYYKNFLKRINERLNSIGQRFGICDKLTTYYARGSWATFAHKLDVPRDTIKLGLGHGKKTVTDGYVDYDLGKVDAANRLVIDYITHI